MSLGPEKAATSMLLISPSSQTVRMKIALFFGHGGLMDLIVIPFCTIKRTGCESDLQS